MKLKNVVCSFLGVALMAGAVSTKMFADDKDLEAKAKISQADAERIALARVPGGKIKEGELEEENGKLIWSFDITKKGSSNIQEIQVDALNGTVVSEKTETPADEAKEAKAEKEEKKGKKEKDDDDKK